MLRGNGSELFIGDFFNTIGAKRAWPNWLFILDCFTSVVEPTLGYLRYPQ